MYKIGTGENGTVAGKIYHQRPTDREGDVAWVYCKGRLYTRRVNEEIGSLLIIDPATLRSVGQCKLFMNELFDGHYS